MLIKSITLNNFRQYKGRQKIDFSINQTKNITVVKGENGSGKTTLLQAFLWCFYQKMDLPKTEKIYNADIFNSLNFREQIEVWVEVEFVHNKEEYTIRRESIFTKVDNKEAKRQGTIIFRAKKKMKNGKEKEISAKEIESKIPEDLSTYFFFDGERIENISKSNNKGKKDISKAVKKILGMDVLSNASAHLNRVSKLFEKEYKDDNTQGIKSINLELDKLRHDQEKFKKEILTTKNEIEIVQEKILDLNEKIKDNTSVAQLQKNREQLEKYIEQYENNIDQIFKDIQKNNRNGLPEFLCNKLMNLCNDKINLNSIEAKGIVGIDGSAIDHILECGQCICGNKITKDSEEYHALIKQKEYQPPASLGTIMSQFNERKNSTIEKSEEFFGVFNSKYIKIEEYKEKIENSKEDIEKISVKLKGSEDVRELEEKRNKLIASKYELDEQLINKTNSLNEINSLISTKETELSKLALTDKRNIVIEMRKRYTQELIKVIDKRYKDKEEKIQEDLNSRVSKLFCELIDTKHTIQLNDDYTFRVVDIDGEDSTSQGQDVITSFSFIGGLIEIAKEKHKELEENEPYPLIMDAPFAKLSKIHRKNVAKIIPNITEQFILFSVDSQYEGDIEENLKEKVGKQYELLMHNEDGKYTEIKEIYK